VVGIGEEEPEDADKVRRWLAAGSERVGVVRLDDEPDEELRLRSEGGVRGGRAGTGK